MPVSPAVFETAGQRTEHYIPGVYSRSNNITSPVGVSAGNLVILGESQGGKPRELLSFGSLAEAKDTLISGELLRAIGYAFNPSNVYQPQRIFAMRVNNGARASLQLKSNNTENLKVYAWDYGSHGNQIKLWVKTGTNTNFKKIVALYKGESVTLDNIGKEAIKIEYIGDGSSPVCTISKTGIKLSATVEEAESDVVEASFEDYPNLDELVTFINDSELYSVTLVDTSTGAKSADLDTCSSIDVSSEATFYSNYKEFIDALLSIPFVGEVEKENENSRVVPDNTESYVYFAGGTSGSPVSASDWSAALSILETKDIQIIATPSTDDTAQNLIVNHCTTMSNTINRKERTCILGAAKNETDENVMTIAKGFNNKLVSFVADSAYANNPLTGEQEEIDGAMLAVMLAGMESAMAVAEPLTFKTLNVLGFSKNRTNTNMETLIKAGVIVCNPNPENINEFVVIRALTTFQGSGDLISCERSMVREDLYMNRDLRAAFVGGIGHPNSPSTDEIVQTLKDRAKEWATNGLLIPDGTDNVQNIKVTFNGDKVYLTYSRFLTAPRNFVFITATNRLYETTQEL